MERNAAVIFDACVLYPAPIRDLLIELAGLAAPLKIFRAKWAQQIHEEWVSNLLESRKDLTREKLQRTCDNMNEAVPDCLVVGYEHRIDALRLPDSGDHHVLAAAIECGARLIVTANLKDFPESYLAVYGVKALSPDQFLVALVAEYEEGGQKLIDSAARAVKARLRKPPMTWNEYLPRLESLGLDVTSKMLRDVLSAEIDLEGDPVDERAGTDKSQHRSESEEQRQRLRQPRRKGER